MPTDKTSAQTAEVGKHSWTFLTNHAHMLLLISTEPELRIREMAQRVGITERAAQRILTELEEGGYITRHREGRRNQYEVHEDVHLRHPIEAHRTVSALLRLLKPTPRKR